MKVAIVGASQNAYRFAEILKARDVEIACVWDYRHSKADAFCRQFGGEAIDDIERIADFGLDGVMICTKRADHVRYALPFIAGGVPTYIDGPSASERIQEAVREHGTPVMFAPVSDTDGQDVYDVKAAVDAFLRICDTGEPMVSP